MSHISRNLVPLAFLCLAVGGCAASRQEILDLHESTSKLTAKLNDLEAQQQEVQISQAALTESMRKLSDSLESLSSQLEENKNYMSSLSMRLDDIDANISERMGLVIELLGSSSKLQEKPSPSANYALAYTDFIRGRYEQAIKGFQNYLEQSPKGERAPNALINLGECYMSSGKVDEAMAQYDKVLQDFPVSDVVPTAYYKKALALEKQQKTQEAAELYNKIITKYPHRKEAAMAKERLTYQGSGR